MPFCGRAGPSNRIAGGSGAGPGRTLKAALGAGEAAAGALGAEAYLLRINSPDWASFVGASKMSNMGGSVISATSSVKAADERAVAWLTDEEWTSLLGWAPRQAAERARARFNGSEDIFKEGGWLDKDWADDRTARGRYIRSKEFLVKRGCTSFALVAR